MKILRKLLLILPILSISFTALLAFISFCLGFGNGIWYGVRGSSAGILSNAYCTNYELEGTVEMTIGNTFNILGMLITAAIAVLVVLNLSEKMAKGPTLLVAAIACFMLQFFFLPRPIMLIYYETQDVGDVFEGFNWATFGFSTLMWIPCLTLFILNKTLFKKVLNGQQPTAKAEPAPKAEEPKAVSEGWDCPNCGAHNTGNFCGKCGTKKPE